MDENILFIFYHLFSLFIVTMIYKFIGLIILLGLIIFSGIKLYQHKDDKNNTKLILYSAILFSSITLSRLFIYNKFMVKLSDKNSVIDNAILTDFVKMNEI